jgi:S-disulfanyl-L-cysteine oxidoreductase SoxD
VKIKFALATLTISIAFHSVLLSQSKVSMWDGIYTPDQAKSGEQSYKKECGGCHGETLEGLGQTPPLAGDDFKSNWKGQTLDDLFEKIQTTMPARSPGSLKREQNAEIVAYMLKFNGYPAGKKALPSDSETLEQIPFEITKPK